MLNGTRPTDILQVEDGKDVHRVLDDLDAAMATDERLFQRAGSLVVARGVLADDAKRWRLKFADGSLVLAPLSPSSLLPRITQHVDYGFTNAKGEWWPKIPSATIRQAFLTKVYWGHIRPIRGIASTPIIHLDGSITSEGYDEATQYLVASSVTLPPIPEAPTEDDARKALAELVEPFDEFPFETPEQRYSPVALALTILLRPVIDGNVPAFLQSAPQKNCGKSLSIKAAALLATGKIPASNTWAREEDEQEKMIGAAADAGADVLFFDNVGQGAIVGGAPLDKVLTCDGQNSFRVLGQSTLKTLPWTSVVAFTANRAQVGGDSDRRIVVTTLMRPDESPSGYKIPELISHIKTHRSRLLSAAFTLVRAWIVAGKPNGVRRLDSFEDWARIVPAVVKWAGGVDVRELVPDSIGTDYDEAEGELFEHIHAWMKNSGRTSATAAEIVADMKKVEGLKESILAHGCSRKGDDMTVDTKKFGRKLQRMRNTKQGSLRLVDKGKAHGGANLWTISSSGSTTSKVVSMVPMVSTVPLLAHKEEDRINTNSASIDTSVTNGTQDDFGSWLEEQGIKVRP